MTTQPTLNPLRTALVTVALLALGIPAQAAVIKVGHPVSGRYIVVLRDAPGTDGLVAHQFTAPGAARELASAHRGRVALQFHDALNGFVFEGSAQDAAALSRDSRVALVEEDGRVWVTESQTPPSWGLDRVDQHPVSLDGLYTYNADGTGIDLYVIDTGIRSTHEDFGNRVDVANGYSTVADGYGTEDCNGHGTHVAAIAGGTTFGVAKNVTLHPVRILDCAGQGQTSDLIAAIDWITARYPAPRGKKTAPPTRAVVNISLASERSWTVDAAVENSIQAGVTYVVAAGNGGFDACSYSPAAASSAIRVGASDGVDARASWSNVGQCVDLFAPGSMITSAYARSDSDSLTMSGTSMAAPHVAGTAALMLSANPKARPLDVKATVVQAATADLLADVPAGSPNRLLYSAFAGGEDLPPLADFYWICSGQDCSFYASRSTDDWGILAYSWSFGDGRTGSGVNATHRYGRNAGGLFQVTLTVTDTSGQTASFTQEVRTIW